MVCRGAHSKKTNLNKPLFVLLLFELFNSPTAELWRLATIITNENHADRGEVQQR
jgi:hypothetical protein